MAEPVILGHDLETATQVQLTYPARKRGTYIIGQPGVGKTATLLNLVMQDVEAGHGLCTIDPQGAWTELILERIPTEREQDVIYVSPAEKQKPFGLHLYDCLDPDDDDLVDLVMSQVVRGVFQEIWGDMEQMPRLADVLRVSCRTLIRCQSLDDQQARPTLIELPYLFDDEDYRHRMVAHLRDRYPAQEVGLIKWWERYERRTPRQQTELTESTLNKVREFSQTAMVKRVVGQNISTLDFRRAMDQGKIVLVDLPEGAVEREVAALIGALVISRIHIAAKSRVDLLKQGQPLRRFHLIVDEFQNFATLAFSRLQNECRQYSVDITIAHQNRMGQLTGETQVQASTLGTSNWIVFQSIPPDAEVLAKGFRLKPPEPKPRGERQEHQYANRPWDELKRQPPPEDEGQRKPHAEIAFLVNQIERALAVGLGAKLNTPGYEALDYLEWEQRGLDRVEDVTMAAWGFSSQTSRDNFEVGLNRVLYLMMTEAAGDEIEPLLLSLCEGLCRYRPVSTPGQSYAVPSLDASGEVVMGNAQSGTRIDWILAAPEGDPPLGEDWGDSSLEGLRDRIWDFARTKRRWLHDLGYTERQEFKQLIGAFARVWMRQLVLLKIISLGDLLRDYPVWARGGQPIVEYERPPTPAELLEWRKDQIRLMPQFQALCRVQEGRQFTEFHLHTIDAEARWPPQDHDPTQRIKHRSRRQYGTDIAQVEAALIYRATFSSQHADAGDEEEFPPFRRRDA
jgi:hypothetical protein